MPRARLSRRLQQAYATNVRIGQHLDEELSSLLLDNECATGPKCDMVDMEHMGQLEEHAEESQSVGRVLGTQDSTPLEFWVAVEQGQYLQLDDVVAVRRILPTGEVVDVFGVVNQVRARHEGARFESDVFLISSGLLPAETSESAQVLVTRCSPETFVPPLPGEPVVKPKGERRDAALYFDDMRGRVPIGLTREGEPLFASLEFIDGSKGAHVNISGISGVATKTSYALFLLYSLFNSGVLAKDAINSKALVFNVKGEDLLFLDQANTMLTDDDRRKYERLNLPATAFASVSFWAPPRAGDANAVPDVVSRSDGAVRPFFWTLYEFCHEGLLPFLFADADDERQQYTIVAQNVMAQLRRAEKLGDCGSVRLAGEEARTFDELVSIVCDRLEDDATRADWAGRSISLGTVNAFVRRFQASVVPVGHLVRGDIAAPSKSLESQITVVDIHNLKDRAQRFVVGVLLRKTMEEKEKSGAARPLWFVVLDELNKYAPREGGSPIKEVLVDIAERGRSLGVILVGAQQTASEVERRVSGMAALRVVGRLDSAESGRSEYGYLRGALAARSMILKPGTMIVSQPLIPVPLVVEFPYPAWATRRSEAGAIHAPSATDVDPFARFEQ